MDLFEFFSKAVIPLRKGLEVQALSGGLPVVDGHQMASAGEYVNNDSYELVDVHFIYVGIRKDAADPYKERFCAFLSKPPMAPLLKEGVTYIVLGNLLGSETAALYLMALAQYYGVGKCVLPRHLGLHGDEADIAASEGSVVLIEKEKEDGTAPEEIQDES